jgi:Mrp family chromosome partitioning ATPase
LFISIPEVNGKRNGKISFLKPTRLAGLLPAGKKRAETQVPCPEAASSESPEGSNERTETKAEVGGPSTLAERAEPRLPASTQAVGTPVAVDEALHAFWDALRDRLITYFEVKNLTHKPKLVALTSCGSGCGVTTIAAGLAAALSQTGDGNVLLVDMNQQQGAAHQFYKGSLTLGLDEALQVQKRDDAMVQENLYVVKEATNGDKLPRVLPKRFTNLMPKLKASDYDYIIFDMPPVSQISVTQRLARFMDIVLMVVESEKTDRDAVKRAAAYLADSKANLGVVMNKMHTYVPKVLHQEL